jgi:hypothetical protein
MQKKFKPYREQGGKQRVREVVRHLVWLMAVMFTLLSPGFCPKEKGRDILKKKVHLQLRRVTYFEALSCIEKGTGARFVYQPVLFQPLKKVSISCRGENLKVLLERLLLPVGVRYELSHTIYIILTKDK